MCKFSLFAYVKNKTGRWEIKRIILNDKLQKELSKDFYNLIKSFIPQDTEKILKFEENIDYKPNDEVFVINDFEIPVDIQNVIDAPTMTSKLKEEDYENIKAIIAISNDKNSPYIILNAFDRRKIIRNSKNKLQILYNKDVFSKLENKVIVVDKKIDVLIKNNKLYFKSFYITKRILGKTLDKYYREATDEEVNRFVEHFFGNDVKLPEKFLSNKTRFDIYGIYKRGLLSSKPDIDKIIALAKKYYNLQLEKTLFGKLSLPKNHSDFKKLLKLLNDNVYKSPLTGNKYETNSKRKLK